jgi:RiboL-PSP-HEPN
VIEDYLIAEASPSPSKIGIVFSTVGKKGFWSAVDSKRGVPKGTSERQLEELAQRRNRIAHTGDRIGYGRATLTVEDAERHFTNAKEIVEALETAL